MPRRDGQPTEQEVAAQRAGQGPPPIQTGHGLAPAVAAAAALAATAAAARAAATAPPVVAPALTVGAINAAAAGITTAFGRFLESLRDEHTTYVSELLESEIPDLPDDLRHEVVDFEIEAEKAFAAKARARLDRDLPKALSIADPAIRESAVQSILDRERRYIEQHETAVASRALGTAEQRDVEHRSPEGGYWKLSEHVADHTLDCLAMGGKVWPHSVLRTYHPPLHGACPCEIWTVDRARQAGLIGPDSFVSHDQAIHALQVVEADWVPDEPGDVLLEGGWDQHWSKGTTKAGQFRPKRGGDPGAVLHRRRGHRLRLPHIDPAIGQEGVRPVASLGHELDVRDLNVPDLAVGDRVMVNGDLDTVTSVDGRTPGLVTLATAGLVHIDRATIRGIPGDQHTVTPTGLPELPKFEPGDRYELRFGPNASLVMWDREQHRPFATWDEWDLEKVTPIVTEENKAQRDRLTAAEPPPATPTGAASHADVLKVARMRRPQQPGELKPGFHFDPNLSRSEARGEDLFLPPGFFRQSRTVREKVLFRHLGSRLADGLGPDGIRALGDQHHALGSRRDLIGLYHALNTESRQHVMDVHPDAARLLAAAAVERGLPIHPDVAKLARRPVAADERAADHPAHQLAHRTVGLHGHEARSLLQAAGYAFSDARDQRATFRNHEQRAAIHLDQSPGRDAQIASADVTVEAKISPEERATLVGTDTRQAHDRLIADGFAGNYTTSGEWLEFVAPDGRGRALRVADTGSHARVIDAVTFTPTPGQVEDARGALVRGNPAAHIRPGMPFEELRSDLEHGHRWRMTDSGNDAEVLPRLTPGSESFVEFQTGLRGDDRLVLHLKRENGHVVIVAGGHGSVDPAKRGRIVPAAEAATDVQARDAEEQRQRDAAAAAAAGVGDELRTAAQNGDTDTLRRLLAEHSPNDAVRLMRQHGFDIRGRRRSGRGTTRRINYTMRGPNGVTVKFSGPHTFSTDARVDRVEVVGNPQAGRRDRLPAGQAPKTLEELLVDSLGRADEIGQRFGAGVHVTAVVQGGVRSGAAAHHEWNGTIAIRRSGEARRLRDYLSRRAAGEALREHDHLAFYNDLETLQHEINHGVAKAGNEEGGLSFGTRHYQGTGKAVEEALTEETGHLLAVDWLRSHGMTDVLEAVKRNPNHPQVLGVYRSYRVSLKRILDDANIPESDRRDLLLRMKFQMTPEERNAELASLAGESSVHAAMSAQPRRRSEMTSNFQPAVRPDLSDIDVSQTTVLIGGRVIAPDDAVTVEIDGARVAGVVVALMDGSVRVRTEDGIERWYPVRRVN